MRAVTGAVLVAGLCAVVLSGGPGRIAGAVLAVLLVGTPFVRVAFLGWRWWQIGDRRFATSAAALLAVVATGVVVAVWI